MNSPESTDPKNVARRLALFLSLAGIVLAGLVLVLHARAYDAGEADQDRS